MGNRANYVLVECGKAQIHFSRWGALVIPAVLLSGPEATTDYVHHLTQDDELLDWVWAEGGVLLNLDRCALQFWSGMGAVKPYLRRPLLTALRALWSGWTVDWMMFGVATLAEAVGCAVEEVWGREAGEIELLWPTSAILKRLRQVDEPARARGLVTIRKESGAVADYLISASPIEALGIGPQLLNVLDAYTASPLPGEGDDPDGVYVDMRVRTIWLAVDETLDPRTLPFIERRWPGWTAMAHLGGLAEHVRLSGRDAAPIMIPEQQAVEELIDNLARVKSYDPVRLQQALTQTIPASPAERVQYGFGFFSDDNPPLSQEERYELLRRLFADVLRDTPSPGA